MQGSRGTRALPSDNKRTLCALPLFVHSSQSSREVLEHSCASHSTAFWSTAGSHLSPSPLLTPVPQQYGRWGFLSTLVCSLICYFFCFQSSAPDHVMIACFSFKSQVSLPEKSFLHNPSKWKPPQPCPSPNPTSFKILLFFLLLLF